MKEIANFFNDPTTPTLENDVESLMRGLANLRAITAGGASCRMHFEVFNLPCKFPREAGGQLRHLFHIARHWALRAGLPKPNGRPTPQTKRPNKFFLGHPK